MKKTLSILRNKYLIASIIFGVWMVFFDRHDLTAQYDYQSQRKELEREKMFYSKEIIRMNKNLEDLEQNPEAIERVAREKYQMKRANEDVYVIITEWGWRTVQIIKKIHQLY